MNIADDFWDIWDNSLAVQALFGLIRTICYGIVKMKLNLVPRTLKNFAQKLDKNLSQTLQNSTIF